jgi:8-oxo-dGTP pyrophosphatase MutT (NUDIX family)
VEFDESPRAAAVREVAEELSLGIRSPGEERLSQVLIRRALAAWRRCGGVRPCTWRPVALSPESSWRYNPAPGEGSPGPDLANATNNAYRRCEEFAKG